MKRIGFLIMLLSISLFANSQIVQEKSYQGFSAITQLKIEGYKYYVIDAVNNKCILYNTDHTLWKEIDIPVPDSNFIAEISYVSQHLFNDDDNIEMVVIFAKYVTSGNFPYYHYTTSVINETGATLMTTDGGGLAEIQKVSEDNAKLLVYVYDLSISVYPASTEVYDIPGVPMKVPDNVGLSSKTAGNPYPNPAGDYVNIPYNLDIRDNTGHLIIFNISGREVRRYKVGKDFESIRVLTTGFPVGTYYYSVKSEHTSARSGKFIVR